MVYSLLNQHIAHWGHLSRHEQRRAILAHVEMLRECQRNHGCATIGYGTFCFYLDATTHHTYTGCAVWYNAKHLAELIDVAILLGIPVAAYGDNSELLDIYHAGLLASEGKTVEAMQAFRRAGADVYNV